MKRRIIGLSLSAMLCIGVLGCSVTAVENQTVEAKKGNIQIEDNYSKLHKNEEINEIINKINENYDMKINKETITDDSCENSVAFMYGNINVKIKDLDNVFVIEYSKKDSNNDEVFDVFKEITSVVSSILTDSDIDYISKQLVTGSHEHYDELNIKGNGFIFNERKLQDKEDNYEYILKSRLNKM